MSIDEAIHLLIRIAAGAAAPAAVLVLSAWLINHASRFIRWMWPDNDRARRDAEAAAQAWDAVFDDLSVRVRSLEGQINAIERRLDKINRALRRHKLTDSTEADP